MRQYFTDHIASPMRTPSGVAVCGERQEIYVGRHRHPAAALSNLLVFNERCGSWESLLATSSRVSSLETDTRKAGTDAEQDSTQLFRSDATFESALRMVERTHLQGERCICAREKQDSRHGMRGGAVREPWRTPRPCLRRCTTNAHWGSVLYELGFTLLRT